METYKVDIRDLLRPGTGVTPRWVLALVKGLDVNSRFHAQKRGGQQFRYWDESRYALVAIADAVRAFLYAYIVTHTEKGKPRPEVPKPIKTPQPPRTKKKVYAPGSFGHMAMQQIARVKKRKER